MTSKTIFKPKIFRRAEICNGAMDDKLHFGGCEYDLENLKKKIQKKCVITV